MEFAWDTLACHTCSYTSVTFRSRDTICWATSSSIPKSSSTRPCSSSARQMKFFTSRIKGPTSEVL